MSYNAITLTWPHYLPQKTPPFYLQDLLYSPQELQRQVNRPMDSSMERASEPTPLPSHMNVSVLCHTQQ